MTQADEIWMDQALEMARSAIGTGNTPVAAVVVRDGVRLGAGGNRVTTLKDPMLHAEVVAIQDACAHLGQADLAGATLYGTMEPCPMCAWAIVVSGIRRVVLGCRHADLNRTDLGTYSFERLMTLGGKSVELVTGVRHAECVSLRRDWMKQTGRII